MQVVVTNCLFLNFVFIKAEIRLTMATSFYEYKEKVVFQPSPFSSQTERQFSQIHTTQASLCCLSDGGKYPGVISILLNSSILRTTLQGYRTVTVQNHLMRTVKSLPVLGANALQQSTCLASGRPWVWYLHAQTHTVLARSQLITAYCAELNAGTQVHDHVQTQAVYPNQTTPQRKLSGTKPLTKD